MTPAILLIALLGYPWHEVVLQLMQDVPKNDVDGALKAKAKSEPGSQGPMTATLPLEDKWRQRVEAVANGKSSDDTALLITVEGVILPGVPGVEARVFLNLPKADAKTSINDDHYLGCFSLGSIEQANRPQNFIVNASQAVRRLVKDLFRSGNGLQITVIGVNRLTGESVRQPILFDGVVLTIE